MSSVLAPQPAKLQPGEPNPFRFGWKEVRQLSPDGAVEYERFPLTTEDLLHPEWGYVIVESTEQERGRRYLNDVFRLRLQNHPNFQSFSDLLILWRKGDAKGHCPDISVFENVPDRDRFRKSLNVAEEGVDPRLFIELVSPDEHHREVRDNDVVTKVLEYERRGVSVYVIVDQERMNGPRKLLGYRNTPAGFVPITPDAHDRIFLDVVNVWIGLREDRVVCYHGDTGEEIPDYVALSEFAEVVAEARDAAVENRDAAVEARDAAVEHRQAAEEARDAAVEHRRAAEEARDAAERFAQAEVASRRAAEEQTRATELRAQLAEWQTREAQARADAEARARAELEAQLQALKAKLQGLNGESS